ncbi:aspartate/glutamate/uridylate kinase [Advenella kashmirensis WT001]|uniref:Aspartate/glutamate/uridylate kinase n=1 Tax=Advenella kashmirensis (strain DSM 17095 / LMG 22695 / WT001) TaxID=1036672 RepID=I3UDT5_ADVKW|nr:aspartate/glutamate/uridylate kinase [Advenella kashmirensis]AFK63173.1 aspartate/glutamate/uridylate kinase [Advenella kashmirensis WT001]
MWVVKLDGALAHDDTLQDWVEELSTVGGGRVIIVPGRWHGADFVREMKARWSLDRLVTHNMLLLTGAQYGLLISSMAPQISPVLDARHVRQTLQRGGVALWMPLSLMRDIPDDLTDSTISSDSIAAWLATHLNAERLILVKTRPFFSNVNVAQHIRDGVLDEGFRKYADQLACPVTLLHKSELSRFHLMLLNGSSSDLLDRAGETIRG